MTPSGVVMASATALTIECVTWMNSILKGPTSTICLGCDLDEDGIALQVVLFQAPLDQRQREGGAVDRHFDIAQEIGNGADVVFVAVGEDEAADLSRVLLEESQVGHYQVYAQQLGFRKHHAAINDDDVLPVADGGHVHAELAQATQGHYVQLVISHSIGTGRTRISHSSVAR